MQEGFGWDLRQDEMMWKILELIREEGRKNYEWILQMGIKV